MYVDILISKFRLNEYFTSIQVQALMLAMNCVQCVCCGWYHVGKTRRASANICLILLHFAAARRRPRSIAEQG